MNNFESWKQKMTVELAKKINKEVERCADDDEFDRVPTTEEDLIVWRNTDNLSEVAQMFSISDCSQCPVDETEEGCPASDSCYNDFYEWGDGDSSWNEMRAEEDNERIEAIESLNKEIDELMASADQGDAQSQFKLGKCYLEKGFLTNCASDKFRYNEEFEQAHSWFLKAAEQGNAPAQARLGEIYSSPIEYSKNCLCFDDDHRKSEHEKAVYWYKKAAEQVYRLNASGRSFLIKVIMETENTKNAEVQFNLGNMYLFGCTIEREYTPLVQKLTEEKNFNYAIEYYIMAAEQGHSGAQYTLGKCYFLGYHNKYIDKEQAVEWLKKAAEQGHKKAIALFEESDE